MHFPSASQNPNANPSPPSVASAVLSPRTPARTAPAPPLLGGPHDMAPSPIVAEGDAAALRVAVPLKNAAFGEESTVRRPGRLRVMHPHVAKFLRSPRRLGLPRPAKKPEAEPARARYACAFEDDEDGARGATGVAAPGRLVWGKVRRHPWWPGQVFDAADASGFALSQRRPRRAAVLVAYFWDKSFAWNDKATLCPFRAGFTRHAARCGMPPLAAAVETALDEVSRRVEAALSCCCCGAGGGKDEAIANRQVIDNAGIREGAYGAAVDAAFARGALRGEAFVGYISALATAPLAGADRVDLAIATAQLKAFGRWRGSTRGLPEYTVVHGIDGVAAKAAKRRRSSSTGDGCGDGSGKRRVSRSGAKGNTPSDGGDYEALELEDFLQPTPQMSTKIGKLMSRAAQQMSVSPVILRANCDAPPAMPRMASCPRFEDKLRPTNNGDHSSGAVMVNERRPAAEMEHHVQVGLVLNFSSTTAVPSATHLTMIFSRFGPIKEVRTENSTALVIFKKGSHADEAFTGTAKISSISSSLISFRLTNLLPAATIDPPHSMCVGLGSPAC